MVHADGARLAPLFSIRSTTPRSSPRESRISLTVERRGINVAVTVEDNGIGIPARDAPKVFDMFTQTDGSIDKSQGGLGLGLHIVQHLYDSARRIREACGNNVAPRDKWRAPRTPVICGGSFVTD
jgi:K+-sensing histidine kinase KdpD